jgi:hypothetical protein
MRDGLVIVLIPRGVPGLAGPTEIATLIEVVHSANVLWEKKVQCPVKCYTYLFVQTGQFAEVKRPPHPPCQEAREIESEHPSHAYPATD